jgi:hypothetical protein
VLITETTLTVPAGSMLDPDITIDLAAILRSESRQDEVATVTPGKAPELLAEFNRSWLRIHDVYAKLEKEKNTAEKEADKRKGILLLEVIPKTLADKGIASAADTRKAVIDTDAEYEILTDRLDQLKAAVLYIKGKLKSFENAYNSVKKIMGEDKFQNYSQHNVSGDTHSRGAGSLVKTPTGPRTFGEAKL